LTFSADEQLAVVATEETIPIVDGIINDTKSPDIPKDLEIDEQSKLEFPYFLIL
jgi:hypothetical protein